MCLVQVIFNTFITSTVYLTAVTCLRKSDVSNLWRFRVSFKVVITMYNRPPSDLTLEVIQKAGIEVEYVPSVTENEVIKAAEEADVLLVGTVPHTTRNVL